MSKLGDFAAKLAKGKGASSDPLDDDYFDRGVYEKERQDGEANLIERSMSNALLKRRAFEEKKESAKYQQPERFERNRYWE